MAPGQLFDRSLYHAAQLDYKAVHRLMPQDVYDKFKAGYEQVRRSQIWFLDLPDASLDTLHGKILAAYHRISPALVVIDHLQLVHVPYAKSEYAEVSRTSHLLKNLQNRLKIPFIVLSQVARIKNDKRVDEFSTTKLITLRLQDMRSSGRVEENADAVILIQSPGRLEDGQETTGIRLDLAKNRIRGGQARWEFDYHFPTGTFRYTGTDAEPEPIPKATPNFPPPPKPPGEIFDDPSIPERPF
jgi:replicative DNA helicase